MLYWCVPFQPSTDSTLQERAGQQISDDTDEVPYEEQMRRLEEEYNKRKPSHKSIRDIMKSTYEGELLMDYFLTCYENRYVSTRTQKMDLRGGSICQ